MLNTSTFAALKHKNFRYFWFGQCISLMGTFTQRTAQAWLVYSLTRSPLLLGLLGVFQFGPMFFFSIFAGALVDRFPKRKIIICSQLVFAIQALTITILAYSGHIKYWHILILALIYGCVQTIEMPSRQSFFVDLVGKEDLINAISLNSTIVNLARIIGPAVAGIIIVKTSIQFCFLLNTLSFIPVVYGLFMIKVNGISKNNNSTNIFNDVKDGLKYIKANNHLKNTFIIMAIVCTFAMNSDVIIPIFAKDVLGGTAKDYSLLLSSMGIGSFVGALFMAKRSKKGPKPSLLFIAGIFSSFLQILMVFSKFYFSSAIMLFIIGFCNLVFINIANSNLQLNSSDEFRGRVMSVYSLVNLGSTPIGNLFTGFSMEHLGQNMGFTTCGLLSLTLIIIRLIVKKNINKNP